MEKYDRVKKLGSGSFGAAILVKRRADRQLFVVKEVNLARMNPREREEARNECKVLQLLIHPNVVRYEEHFERRNILYIVMEYADGGDLHQKIVNQKSTLMREDTAMHYFVQMCLALDYLHSRHILHRDIKAMNIFLTSNGTVKLGDFGISTILRNTMGMANTVCGTPYYFSPELCKNRPYNNKSDVWALGVCLFELLSLRHPYDASNLNQLMQRILKNPVPNIPSIYGRETREVINMTLEKDHRKRPSVRALLQKDIVRRALLRLQGDLGAATTTNQRLQQIVAERISTGSNDYKNPGAFNNNNNPNDNNKNSSDEELQRKKQQHQEKQEQQRQQVEAQKAQQAAAAAKEMMAAKPKSRSPSPQANPIAIRQQPQIAIHDPRHARGNNNMIGGGVAGALGAVCQPNNNNQGQQQGGARLPPPPQQQYNKPIVGLAERMAEMERQRAARIRQLEQERKETEERERREIAEARKAAAARVAVNRQRRADEVALREKREKDEREAYRKRHGQRQPVSGRGGSKDSKDSNNNNNNKNRRPSNVSPPISSRQQQEPINVAQKMAAQGQGQQAQQQQPSAAPQQDQRPAISNAYLAHLRDVQANRQQQQPGNNNNPNTRQAAGDWVEREQMRRMGQQQQQAGGAMADIFGGGGGGGNKQQQQQPVKLEKDVEKWLADEQKKKWNNGGANNANNNNQQQQQNRNLPPMMNQNNFMNNNNNGNNNNIRNPRPMTPPPSPSQHLKPNIRRKHGAVEPLMPGDVPSSQQQQQHQAPSAQQQQQRRYSQDVVANKKLPMNNNTPQQNALLMNPPSARNDNNNNDFRQKLEQAKRGQHPAAPVVQQQQNRDRSAPPILSPKRQAPVSSDYYYMDSEESGNMELGCEAEILDVVPSKSGDFINSDDDDIEAHEELVVQGQGNRYAEEKRLKEYNAIGHHIQTLLAQKDADNKNKNNNNKNQNDDNGDDFQEMTALDEEEDISSTSSTSDDDENDSNDEELGVNNNNANKKSPQQQALKPVDQNKQNNNKPQATGTANTFPLLHLCGGVAFARWWQSVGNTHEEAAALRAALVRRLKREEIVGQVMQLLNMACTSVNGTDGSLAVNMWKMVEPFVNQVRKVLKTHIVKSRLIENGSDDVIEGFVDEVVQTASRVVFFEGYAHAKHHHHHHNNAQQQSKAVAVNNNRRR